MNQFSVVWWFRSHSTHRHDHSCSRLATFDLGEPNRISQITTRGLLSTRSETDAIVYVLCVKYQLVVWKNIQSVHYFGVNLENRGLFTHTALETVSPLLLQFCVFSVKRCQHFEPVDLSLLTQVAHLLCGRLSSVHCLLNHSFSCLKCFCCATDFDPRSGARTRMC